MNPLRIGIVGAGVMGADHARTLHRAVGGAEVTLIADVDRARAEAVAEQTGGQVADDALAAIASGRLDGLIVASADPTHAELVLAAIAADLPVLCEKPLAPTVAEVDAIIAAEAAGTRPLVQVGFMRRFDPAYVQLRQELLDGRIGAPLLVHAVHRNRSTPPGWSAESSIVNSLVHELDVLPWLLGDEVTEVLWTHGRPSPRAGFADPQLTLLRFRGGVLATVEVFTNAGYGYDVRAEVVGETGTLELVDPALVVTRADGGFGSRLAADWRPRFADAYRIELQAWTAAIRDRPERPIDGPTSADGRRAALLTEAVLASRRSGGWQHLPETSSTAHTPVQEGRQQS